MAATDRPLVTGIRRLSMDDGPGLRTVVFLKGCPLACSWCHNPENIARTPQVMWRSTRCVGCGACVTACPQRLLGGGSRPRLAHTRCTACGRCTEACPTRALVIAGTFYPVEQLLEILLADAAFQRSSGGGVTLSGGEPGIFPEYVSALAQGLQAAGVPVALETAGSFPWRSFSTHVVPFVDLVLFDLKLFDAAEHVRHTGRSNERILDNFVRLCERTAVDVVPRVPLVPGITDTPDNIALISEFVKGRRCRPIQFLPYNSAGEGKRRALGSPGGRSRTVERGPPQGPVIPGPTRGSRRTRCAPTGRNATGRAC